MWPRTMYIVSTPHCHTQCVVCMHVPGPIWHWQHECLLQQGMLNVASGTNGSYQLSKAELKHKIKQLLPWVVWGSVCAIFILAPYIVAEGKYSKFSSKKWTIVHICIPNNIYIACYYMDAYHKTWEWMMKHQCPLVVILGTTQPTQWILCSITSPSLWLPWLQMAM